MSETIHRAEYTPAKAKRFISKKTPCLVQLKTPALFANAVKKAMPSEATACEFDKIRIRERFLDNSDAEAHGWGGEVDSRKLEQEKGWKFLGCGAHRCGFKIGDNAVLKVGKPERKLSYTGLEANKYEVAAYTLADPEVKEVLVPIVAHSPRFKWLVVPAARTRQNDSLSSEALNEIEGKIAEYLDSVGASCRDIHSNNVGDLDGKPVLIDFGFGVSCKMKPKQQRLSAFLQRSPTRKPVEQWQKEEGIKPSADEYFAPEERHGMTPKVVKGIDTEIHSLIDAFWAMRTSRRRPIVQEKVRELIADARKAYQAGHAGEAVENLRYARELMEKP